MYSVRIGIADGMSGVQGRTVSQFVPVRGTRTQAQPSGIGKVPTRLPR